MQELNFPQYDFQMRESDGKKEIFDSIRKKFLKLTPEEWVRQHIIKFLNTEFSYPLSLMSVEKGLKLNDMQKRTDVVVYNRNAKPLMVVECKAPGVKLSQDTFDQAARYNLKINAKYILITNGLKHYICLVNKEENKIQFLKKIPKFNEL